MHAAVAVDLPRDDDGAGFPECADRGVDAVGPGGETIVVAQPLGGFTAPPVCQPADWVEQYRVDAP